MSEMETKSPFIYRVPLWERWLSVFVCGCIGMGLVAYCYGFTSYAIMCIHHHGFFWPPMWWYVSVGTACGMAALFFAPMGWTDPPWGGVTFEARIRQ